MNRIIHTEAMTATQRAILANNMRERYEIEEEDE